MTNLPTTTPPDLTDLAPEELESATIAHLILKDPSDLTREERLKIVAKIRAARADWLAAAQTAKRDGKRISVPKAAKAPKALKLSKEELQKITLDDLGI